MVPPDQRLETGDVLAGSIDAWLIGEPQLAPLERDAQVRFHELPHARGLVHLRREEAVAALAGGLRGVERKIGVAHQVVRSAVVIVGGNYADRCADRHRSAADGVRPRQAVDDALRQLRQVRLGGHARHNDLEFVAAEPADLSPVTHFVGQPERDEPQQRVPSGVAERIVDRFEAIEIEQEHRAAVLPPDRADEGVVERAAKSFAVGEPGQRVLTRKPVELDLGLPHLGQVGGEAAKAEEAAHFVVDRTAGDRPPDLVLGLGPDDEILKRNVRRKIETESPFGGRASVGGFGRNEVGERPLEQVGRLASEAPSYAVADVRQCSVARRFPKPAFLAALEFLDERLGSRGLRTRLFLGRSTARS